MPPVSVEPPAHLSKKSSELKNDPLYAESFFEAFGSVLNRNPDDPIIHSTTEGLQYIDSVLYKEYITKAAGFNKRVPPSALSYYLATLTYARLVQIHLENGFETDWQTERFSRDVQNARSYPCTAVYAKRILAEFNVPREQELLDDDKEEEVDENDDSRVWNLPQAIRPAGNLIRNRNLQGWLPSQGLSRIQQAFLAEAGVVAGLFECENQSWNFNRKLMEAVSIELSNLQHIEAGDCPTVVAGSQGQIPFNKPQPPEHGMTLEIDCDRTGSSLLEVAGPIANLGVKHLYRTQHIIENNTNWAIFWNGRGFYSNNNFNGRQEYGEEDGYGNQSFNNFRGRGRGRSRSRGGGKGKEERPPHHQPQKQEMPPVSVEPPAHLSKKSSELKNDPLYAESFFEAFGSVLNRNPDDPIIHSTTEGLQYAVLRTELLSCHINICEISTNTP
ncbi:unnamed protein product [Diabrotica balteata]|uniref:Uncharacterized protein n=1 Tax=Diabrotica balteata TaxID=107213 RepID=A0A9N9XIH7_DIABA|nr:unnamed protein product [Diabrotica balteata]